LSRCECLGPHQQRGFHGRHLDYNNGCPYRYGHDQSWTHIRAGVPDSEVVTVALVAAKYFANNHRIALNVMHQLQYLSGSISHSRLNRRLHALREWMVHMPELLADMLSTSTIYIIDSMPIPVCRRARAKRCTKVAGAQYDGTCYAKNERYFGRKLHLVCGVSGIPTRFLFAQLAHMTPRQSTIWHARCHLGHYYSVIVATSVNRCAISSMPATVSR